MESQALPSHNWGTDCKHQPSHTCTCETGGGRRVYTVTCEGKGDSNLPVAPDRAVARATIAVLTVWAQVTGCHVTLFPASKTVCVCLCGSTLTDDQANELNSRTTPRSHTYLQGRMSKSCKRRRLHIAVHTPPATDHNQRDKLKFVHREPAPWRTAQAATKGCSHMKYTQIRTGGTGSGGEPGSSHRSGTHLCATIARTKAKTLHSHQIHREIRLGARAQR